jgi:hypothetical protein
MTTGLSSEMVVDLVLVVLVAEGLALLAYHWRTGRGIAPAGLLPNLAAGGALLLALRGALAGAHPGWIALWLAAAFAAHLADLRTRLPTTRRARLTSGRAGLADSN